MGVSGGVILTPPPMAVLMGISPGKAQGADAFDRSNRPLAPDHADTGQSYSAGVGGPLVPPVIQSGQMQMQTPAFGANSGSELFMSGTVAPLWVGGAALWYPLTTVSGFVAIVSCAANLTNSVQFGLFPNGNWSVGTVTASVQTTLASGTLARAVPVDGITSSYLVMTWNGTTSVTYYGPQGLTGTVTDASIGVQWGAIAAWQISRSLVTDHIPAFTAIAKG